MNWIRVIKSGSKGNCTILYYNNNCYIIDIGVSLKDISAELDKLSYENIYVLITHDHGDHIRGLKQFIKKYSCVVYGSKALNKHCDYSLLNKGENVINDLKIDVLNLSHDCDYTYGYIFYPGSEKIVYAADTGFISSENLAKMHNPTILMLESNHDVEMLMQGKYHWHLKKRVIGDKGHLSNFQFSNYTSHIIGDMTKEVVALHLSAENNCKSLVQGLFDDINNINCQIAHQEEGSHIIHFNS